MSLQLLSTMLLAAKIKEMLKIYDNENRFAEIFLIAIQFPCHLFNPFNIYNLVVLV